MAVKWQMQTKEVLQSWLDAIADDSELDAWEQGFVENIKEQLTARGTLTRRQQEILERIYAEKTP